MPAMDSGPSISRPLTMTLPAEHGHRPVTRRISVDLPHPDGPTTATNSPLPMRMLACFSASVPSAPP